MVFEEIIEFFAFFFGFFGALIVIYGGIRAVIHVVKLEAGKKSLSYADIRSDFTHKIVFGLEFFIAADVLKTLISPSRDELILLGAVVGIRTVLAYFLSMEVKELEKS